MSLKVLYGLVATAVAALGSIITFKPESVFSEDYSFFQYAMSVLAVPLLLIGLLLLAAVILCSLRGSRQSLQTLVAWKDLPFKALAQAVMKQGIVSALICCLALGLAGVEAYRLARNSYSFARDRLFPQYRLELLSRHAWDLAGGNLYAAKQGYADYAERFKGQETAADAAQAVRDIERMLAVKSTLLTRARNREKTFGLNRTSLHMKVEALGIHPWDTALRDEVEHDLKRAMTEYLEPLLADVPSCAMRESLSADKVRLGRHFMMLGFERAAEAGIKNAARPEEWRDRFCDLVGAVPRERVQSLVAGIWQQPAIDKLLEKNRPQALQEKRLQTFAHMRQAEAKWLWFLGGGQWPAEPVAVEAPAQEADALGTEDFLPPPRMLKEAAPTAP